MLDTQLGLDINITLGLTFRPLCQMWPGRWSREISIFMIVDWLAVQLYVLQSPQTISAPLRWFLGSAVSGLSSTCMLVIQTLAEMTEQV